MLLVVWAVFSASNTQPELIFPYIINTVGVRNALLLWHQSDIHQFFFFDWSQV